MAIAPTLTITQTTVFGNKRVKMGYMTTGGADTYAAGGFAVTAANFGLKALQHLSLSTGAPAAGATGMSPRWDQAAGLIELYQSNFDAAADTPLAEVGAGENVFSYVLHFIAIGY